jgi:hypothetical protein
LFDILVQKRYSYIQESITKKQEGGEMTMERENFRGMEFPLFRHKGCKEDEVFMQFVSQAEVDSGISSPWKTLRLGEPETDEQGKKVYPVFVKKSEIESAGGMLVPARENKN